MSTLEEQQEWAAAAQEWAEGDEAILRSTDADYAKRAIKREARQQAAAARDEWKRSGAAERDRVEAEKAKQAARRGRGLPKRPGQRQAGGVSTPVHVAHRRHESYARWVFEAVILVAALVILVLAVAGVFHHAAIVPAPPTSCPVHAQPGWVVLQGVRTWCGLP